MVISAFRKGLFPEWLILNSKNKDRCTLLKVFFSPWGTSFLWAGAVACAVCSWFPAEQSKSLLGQAFTLQDPGPWYLTYHRPSFLQAPQVHLTSGTVMNIACFPAPLSWCASSAELGDCVILWFHQELMAFAEQAIITRSTVGPYLCSSMRRFSPTNSFFLVWMRLEMMGTGGSGYPDIFFPCSDSDNTSQLWGKEGWFFCFYTEDWKLWFNPWTV